MGLTPMMRQYLEMHEQAPDAILMFRLGDLRNVLRRCGSGFRRSLRRADGPRLRTRRTGADVRVCLITRRIHISRDSSKGHKGRDLRADGGSGAGEGNRKTKSSGSFHREP